MANGVLARPHSCQRGKMYLLKIDDGNDSPDRYREVIFIAYCPSAGQVIVRDNGRNEIVPRKDLYHKPL